MGPSPPGWSPIPGVEGAWHIVRVRQGVPLRSTAIRLADGSLAINSPTRGLGAEAHAELAALGRPTLLVAPNQFHNLGLAEFASRYPGVVIVASAAARARVARKCGHPVSDESPLRAALSPSAFVHVPPVTRNGELWLSLLAGSSRAWIVGDAFFNIARTPRSPMGLLLRLLGISPGLRIGSSFRWLVRDRAAYRQWALAALAREAPSVLVPCHGEVLAGADLTARLQRLVEARL